MLGKADLAQQTLRLSFVADVIEGKRTVRRMAAMLGRGRPGTAAFAPAMSPWAAASSYPVVPLICPARNRPRMPFVSSVGCRHLGST